MIFPECVSLLDEDVRTTAMGCMRTTDHCHRVVLNLKETTDASPAPTAGTGANRPSPCPLVAPVPSPSSFPASAADREMRHLCSTQVPGSPLVPASCSGLSRKLQSISSPGYVSARKGWDLHVHGRGTCSHAWKWNGVGFGLVEARTRCKWCGC
ncbi:hypothetical protein DENSPDRAFT_840644 [Dentipellis sp. KUC8613]|nr:hypothetical protein DENSPDRAFT_840644 [Dentipellis sp. KUC8613]